MDKQIIIRPELEKVVAGAEIFGVAGHANVVPGVEENKFNRNVRGAVVDAEWHPAISFPPIYFEEIAAFPDSPAVIIYFIFPILTDRKNMII